MVIFEIAILVAQKGGGYVVRRDLWDTMFAQHNPTNEIFKSPYAGVFGGKPLYQVKISSRTELLFILKFGEKSTKDKDEVFRIYE